MIEARRVLPGQRSGRWEALGEEAAADPACPNPVLPESLETPHMSAFVDCLRAVAVNLVWVAALGAMDFAAGATELGGFQTAGSDAFGRPVEVLRSEIVLSAGQYVRYPGPNVLTRRAFPLGFPRAMGSGICLKGSDRQSRTFWVLGDRGPNGDGPEVDGSESKIFPVPHYVPAYGVVRLSARGAALETYTEIRGTTGLPGASGGRAATEEVALSESLARIGHGSDRTARGIDSESIACGAGKLWIAEEYGPSVLRVDPVSGQILERFTPDDGLPGVFAQRRANRGIEALTYDAERNVLIAALQSPIDDGSVEVRGKQVKVKNAAPFIRWVELRPATRQLRQFAYPVAASDYEDGKSGNAKLGDLAAVGGGRYVVIEEGKDGNGQLFNRLYLVDTAGATDIHPYGGGDLERSAIAEHPVGKADWRAVVPLRKRLLVELRALGWDAEKAEGLAYVDERTLALTNDDDYAMESALFDADRQRRIDGNIERCRAQGDGTPLFGDRCPNGARSVVIVNMSEQASRQHLWLLRFARPLRTD